MIIDDEENIPMEMGELSAEVRYKAMDLMQELVNDDNIDELEAVPMAIERAKAWARDRNYPVWRDEKYAKYSGYAGW